MSSTKHNNQNPKPKALAPKWSQEWVFYSVLGVLMLFFAIYTSLKFPYTYITIEGNNFWALTRDYWQLKLGMTPALTNWLADFLKQFYRSPYIAAAIEALVLGAIGLLSHSILKYSHRKGWQKTVIFWMGLLLTVLLGFYCTFNLSFLLECFFFCSLLLIYLKIPTLWGRILWSLFCVPAGFMLMQMPILLSLVTAQGLTLFEGEAEFVYSKKKLLYYIPTSLLCLAAPFIYSQQVAFIPSDIRFSFRDFYLVPLTGVYNQNAEILNKIVCMANEERWEDLLYKEHVKRDAQRGSGIALRYALLAESALGTLPENLLDYPIRDESLFLYQHERELVTLQFNRLFYQNLGIYDEAFHHAMEYGLLMPNGINFSSLRQMVDYSIEEGEWEIADKYLTLLSKSTCHKDFVKERRAKMENAKSSNGKSEVPLRADNFVGGYPLPIEMLRLARYYQDSPNRKKMVDYAICSYILRGDIQSFMIAIQAFDFYKDKELPRAYQQFMESARPSLP
ncbi:MAG: hypothetical protein J6V92_00760 [Bacteroidaceae bacterium]|nr:hypothetical protein [Bacteroidaceae bacterium]